MSVRATPVTLLLAFASAQVPAAGPQPAGPLPADAGVLDRITATGRALSVETKIDRRVYTVTDDVTLGSGAASDVLSLIPSVDVDPDGVVSLRGDTSVLLLIDGKPSTLFQGSAAGDNLQSLSAQDIERIEVLTTPPPQFKAEGSAGVINIITRRRRARGRSGTLQGSLGNGGRAVVAAGLDDSGPGGTVSLTAGFREDYRERRVDSAVGGTDPSSGLPQASRSGFAELAHRQVPSIGVSGEFNPTGHDVLRASASWLRRGGLRTYAQRNDSLDGSGAVSASSGRLSSGHDPEDDYDASLRLSHTLGRPGETLDLALHRSQSHQHEHYDYTNQSFLPAAPDFPSNLDFVEDHRISEANADYVLPLSALQTVKLGYAFEEDQYGFDNVGENVDPATGQLAVDPSLTNDFHHQRRIHAVYGSLQAGVEGWSWLGGLRAEWTASSAQPAADAAAGRGHDVRLFPSLRADHSLSEQSTLSLGAARRINRPAPADLNPHVDREYTPNLRSGNADLQPQITDSFDLGFEYDPPGATYLVNGYYRRNRDSVTDVIQYLGNGYSLDTKENLPRSQASGLEFQASAPITPKLSCSASGNAFRSQIDARALGASGLQSTHGINLKAKVDYRPTARDAAQFTFTRTDRRLTPQGTVSAINLVNAGYRRTFTRQLTLVATVTDLFNGQRFVRTVSTPTLTQTYQRSVAGRVVFVGLVFTFGQAGKEKAPGFDYDGGE